MYFNYSVPDLVVLATVLSFILCLLVAVLNLDSINTIGLGYYNTLTVSYKKNRGLVRFFESPFRLTLNLASITNHPGWKAGLSIFSLLLSFIFLATVFFLVYVNGEALWHSVLWPILKWVLIIIAVLIVLLLFANK